MALINCSECGKEASDQAKACPHCGATKFKPKPSKKPISNFVKYSIAAVFFIMVMKAALSPTPSPSEPQPDDGKQKPSLTISECKVRWEMKYKSQLKDPDSLEWDRRNAKFVAIKDIPAVVIPYRARNGFGAITLEAAACKIDLSTGKVIEVM